MEWSWEMTNLIEEQLAEGMRERVAGIALTTDIVGPTVRTQQRRTMMTRTGYAVGVVGLVGALAAGVLTAGGTGPGATPDRQSVAGAESPQLRLGDAVAASQGVSYRVKNTIIPRSQPRSPSMVITGAFDPATATGYIRIASGDAPPWHEERLVDGDLYRADVVAGHRVDWQHDPGKHTNLPYDPKTGVLALSADPQELLAALTQSGGKISQTGPDRYHFEVTLPPRKAAPGGRMVGNVTVGSDERIARVVYEATLRFATETAVLDATLELSDYGAPVTVERPGGTFDPAPDK
jgi:hypothetical protein